MAGALIAGKYADIEDAGALADWVEHTEQTPCND